MHEEICKQKPLEFVKSIDTSFYENEK